MRKRIGITSLLVGLILLAGLIILRMTDLLVPVKGGFFHELVFTSELGLPLPMPFTLSAILVDLGVFLAGRRKLAEVRELMISLIVLAAFAVMSDVSESFLRWPNLSATLLAVSIQAIIAIGMTVLLVSGGFDLSVGATAGLAGAVAALILQQLCPAKVPIAPYLEILAVALAILTALAVGSGVGAANGMIIARIGINPFITTLGMMGIVRGLLLIITQNKTLSNLPRTFTVIGQGGLVLAEQAAPTGPASQPTAGAREIISIQFPILISIVLVVVGDLLLRKSRFFRQNYYIGGNEKAAIFSGIRVDRMKVFNYALTGLLAAAAGVILTARLGAASVTAGLGLELQVISAVIIGGASLQGGEGTVLGAFLGSILMAIIVGSLTLLSANVDWQELIVGATLLLAVMIDTLGKKRRGVL